MDFATMNHVLVLSSAHGRDTATLQLINVGQRNALGVHLADERGHQSLAIIDLEQITEFYPEAERRQWKVLGCYSVPKAALEIALAAEGQFSVGGEDSFTARLIGWLLASSAFSADQTENHCAWELRLDEEDRQRVVLVGEEASPAYDLVLGRLFGPKDLVQIIASKLDEIYEQQDTSREGEHSLMRIIEESLRGRAVTFEPPEGGSRGGRRGQFWPMQR